MNFAFNSFNDFIHMGGYSVYVWSAYGITFLVLFILVFHSARLKQRILHQLQQKVQREQQLKSKKSQVHEP